MMDGGGGRKGREEWTDEEMNERNGDGWKD